MIVRENSGCKLIHGVVFMDKCTRNPLTYWYFQIIIVYERSSPPAKYISRVCHSSATVGSGGLYTQELKNHPLGCEKFTIAGNYSTPPFRGHRIHLPSGTHHTYYKTSSWDCQNLSVHCSKFTVNENLSPHNCKGIDHKLIASIFK